MACLAFVRKTWAQTVSKAGQDGTVLKNMVVNKAIPGTIHTSMKIGKEHLNNHDTIHGGAILAMVDTVTSVSLQSLGMRPPTGASVNISCEFIRPGGKVGDEIKAVGKVLRVGRTLAFTRVEFFNQKDQIVAFGNHTKHMANSHQVVAFSEDGEKEIPVPDNAPHGKDPALAKKK